MLRARVVFGSSKSVLAYIALAVLACTAHAQEARGTLPALNWVRLEGASDCLSVAALAERIEARVGRGLFAAATEAELFVDGSVRGTQLAQGKRAFAITLQVSGRSGEVLGERVLSMEGEACSVIDEAVTLVIAVTLDPKSALLGSGIPLAPETAASLHALFGAEPTDPDPSTLPKHAGEAEVAPPAQEERDAPLQREAEQPIGFGLDAAGVAGLGQLPGLRVALAGYVRFEPSALFPLELGAAHFFERATEVTGSDGAVDFALTVVSLTGCPWAIARDALRACVGLEGGLLSVSPRGLEVTERASRDVVLNGHFGLVFRPRVAGPLHLRMGVMGAVPFAQRAFSYTADGGPRTLFRMAPLQGRAEIGAGVSF